jgi:hypothetical protein
MSPPLTVRRAMVIVLILFAPHHSDAQQTPAKPQLFEATPGWYCLAR